MYIPRLLRPPRGSFFLLGPRGTGKSMWARRELPQARRIDLLEEALYHAYLGRPDAFADELRALKPGTTVVVDEVQRVPSLLNEVHRFIEERRLRFILMGSSARKLKQHGTNLLAGRALLRRMHPFVPAELGAAFDLAEALRYGTLPVIWGAPDREESLAAYVHLYLREEIRAEALVRRLPGFVRFLPIAALFHGQTLNVSSLARDAEVSRTTVVGYLQILEDTLLAFRLPAYEGRLRVRERRHPKLYWIDAGLVRAVQGRHGPPAPEEMGALFEGWVANLLRIHNDAARLFDEWCWWSPAETKLTEVDFLLRRGREWIALEVKHATRVDPGHLRGLRAVTELRGLRRRILVTLAPRPSLTADGIDVWPVERLLNVLAEDRLWP
jgi:predicted AAA+ superfamily ATPase